MAFAACQGENNGEVMLQNAEVQSAWNDAMKARLYDGRCQEYPKPLPGIVHRVVRASLDWEDDIVFLVEFEDEEGNPADIYSLVWEGAVIQSGADPRPMKGQGI